MIVECAETLREYKLGSGDFEPQVWITYQPDTFIPLIKELVEARTVGRIDICLDLFSEIDLDILEKILQETTDYLIEAANRLHQIPLIPLLNGFMTRDKFIGWGWYRLFQAEDGTLFIHPRMVEGTEVKRPREDDFWIQLTRPHLACLVCPCFFCFQDIIHNKVKTSEYKIPSQKTCQINTIFNAASMRLLKEFLGLEWGASNLDVLDGKDYDPQAAFDQLKEGNLPHEKLKHMIDEMRNDGIGITGTST